MSHIKKIALLFLVLLVVGSIWVYKQFCKVEVIRTNETTQVLNLANGRSIYIRAKVWGVSGNHEEIVFSESPITIPKKESDYIFYTDEVTYKAENNKLTIYAPQSGTSIPDVSFKNVEVVFKGLKKADEIKDYSDNYRKYGLERISIYNK